MSAQHLVDPALDDLDLRSGEEVLPGIAAGAGGTFNREHVPGFTGGVGQWCGEQARTGEEVSHPLTGLYREPAADGGRQHLRGAAVNLPEPGTGHAEIMPEDGFPDPGAATQPGQDVLFGIPGRHRHGFPGPGVGSSSDFPGDAGQRARMCARRRNEKNQRRTACRGGSNLHPVRTGEVHLPQFQGVDGTGGQRHLLDGNQVLGAVRVHGKLAARSHREACAGAPAQPVSTLLRSGFHGHVLLDPAKALQLFREDCTFDPALLRKFNMTELRAAHGQPVPAGSAQRVGGGPEMLHPVRRCLEDLHGVGPPELGLLPRIGQPCPDAFAGQRVPDKNNPPLVPGHKVSSVRGCANGQFKLDGHGFLGHGCGTSVLVPKHHHTTISARGRTKLSLGPKRAAAAGGASAGKPRCSRVAHYVIMGCGRVGAMLAHTLDNAGHSVAVIDQEPRAFRRLRPTFGGTQVTGVGFDRTTLTQAGIEKAFAFAAVSSGDNSNILATRVARETFHVPHVVARIYDPGRAEIYQRLGIPTVAAVRWSADQVLRRILPEQSINGDFRESSGRLILGELSLDPSWLGHPLHAVEAAAGVRIAYVTRFGEGMLPRPDTSYQQGDVLHAMMNVDRTAEISRILSNAPAKENQ